ncbi:MAG: hypothetical protein JWN60_2807 [Acidobacteria bacterium]|jgi:hypothetical protein|nr:hypothetical protein [Acidobacteriota bacterium]
MFCPKCGANNTTEQKFCRLCGLNLEQTSVSLLEQVASVKSAELFKRQRKLEKLGNFTFGGFGLVCLIAVGALIYFVFTRMILSGSNAFFGSLLIAFIVFAGLTLAYVAFEEELKESKQKLNPALLDELPEKRATGNLLKEESIKPAVSVTEDSTELLYAKNNTRKLK